MGNRLEVVTKSCEANDVESRSAHPVIEIDVLASVGFDMLI